MSRRIAAALLAALALAGCAGNTGRVQKMYWFGADTDRAVTREGPHGPFRNDRRFEGGRYE